MTVVGGHGCGRILQGRYALLREEIECPRKDGSDYGARRLHRRPDGSQRAEVRCPTPVDSSSSRAGSRRAAGAVAATCRRPGGAGDTLTFFDPDYNVQPQPAESLEPDGTADERQIELR